MKLCPEATIPLTLQVCGSRSGVARLHQGPAASSADASHLSAAPPWPACTANGPSIEKFIQGEADAGLQLTKSSTEETNSGASLQAANPNPEFEDTERSLQVPASPYQWPAEKPLKQCSKRRRGLAKGPAEGCLQVLADPRPNGMVRLSCPPNIGRL